MKLNHKLRQIWHDIYYHNSPKEFSEFAMRCRDVSSDIDLHKRSNTLIGRFRFWLHLSLCQACKNYYDLSKTLSKAVREKSKVSTFQVDDLNKQLLKKHAQAEDNPKAKKN